MITKLNKARFAISRVQFLTPQLLRHQSQLMQTPQASQPDISILQKNIASKSEQGRQLAAQIKMQTPLSKFEKEARYEIFINKMLQLYRSEKRFAQKQRSAYNRMRTAILNSQTPVRLILSEYNKLTSRGFNCEVLANSLEHLQTTLHARGNSPKVYADYSTSEMDLSWRMEKVAMDLKFGLTSENAYFSSNNMGRISRNLGEIGYKNTELISLWFEKIENDLQNNKIFVAGPSFEESVVGSMKNFTPRHYIYQGYASNQEFQEHMDTLVYYKTTQKKSSSDQNIAEIEDSMSKLVKASVEMRELQIDQLAAIESLREQFFRLQNAQDKHEFLKQNKYLIYDMLELQELLVKGGYLDPNEALLGQKDSQDLKMERASQIFYDLVLNQQPELLSPQYTAFYDASVASQTPKEHVAVADDHNKINLKSLSNILIGLADQALSFRRDVRDKDYPNKFYEELLMPEEQRIGNVGVSDYERLHQQKYLAETVLMERTYLNAWQEFSTQSDRMVQIITNMVKNESKDVDGQLHALRALSACRHESRDLRDQIISNISRCLKNSKVSPSALVDGFYGIASCAYQPSETLAVLNQLLSQTDLESLSFNQKVELLNAMALLQMKKVKQLQDIIAQVDRLPFERTDNELTYRQFELLHEVYESLKLQGSSVNFKNKNLLQSLSQFEHMLSRYRECRNLYDPLKDRVVSGLAKGLNSDLNKVSLSQQLSLMQEPHTVIKPNIMTGVNGKKVALYVLNQSQFMKDTMTADGRTAHFMKLYSQKASVNNVAIPLDSVVSYDLNKFQLKLRDTFNLQSLIGSPTKETTSMVRFSKFAQSIAQSSVQAFNLGLTDSNMDMFLAQILQFFSQKDRSDHLHELEQVLSANDDLKLQLIKLSLIHDTKLSSLQKIHVKNCCDGQTFSDLVTDMRQSLEKLAQKETCKFTKLFDQSWLGTRQSVELPVLSTQKTSRKSITPELLCQKFLQTGDYHQYDDWKTLMQETYDQFNLLQVPESQNKININYDQTFYKRKVPKGIFPNPNQKREILKQPLKLIGKINVNNDRFTQFEANPMQYMLEKELVHSETLKPISNDVSMICNLQNIKQGLKSDYSDEEIIKTLLLKLSFTDKLIEEHLNNQQKTVQPKFLFRNPESFRKHLSKTVVTQSPFNQFYLREALKHGNAKELFAKVQDLKLQEGSQAEIEQMVRQIEDILIKNEAANEDLFNLSKGLDNFLQVNFDLKSLGVLDAKPTTSYSSITNEDFLQQERCLSESRLIKSKIIYKVHSGIELSRQEKLYLKNWQTEMIKNDCLLEECLVPSKPSSLSLSDLDADDFFTLNSIPQVQLIREKHGDYALNDLCVEVAQVLDRETVRNVELSCLQENIKKEWNLQKDFKLVHSRNKEISLVLAELEELAWRHAGQFDLHELESIKSLVSVGRGEDHFDRQFVNQDMESLDQFLSQSNLFDTRIELLEAWLARKEQEIKSRVTMPTAELQRPDSEISAIMEARYKPIREKLVAEMLKTDEFGNAKTQKSYKHLNSGELHQLSESLCVRLHLFSKNYPAFLPQVVRAVMDHENLLNTDYSKLDTYCKMFELDWRGDQTIMNRDQFLATHPIYLHARDRTCLERSVNNDSVRQLLSKACQPYLSELASKMMK